MSSFVPRIDTRATARFVLGQQWAQASSPQRQRFRHAFERHVIATYALLLNRFAEEVINRIRGLTMRAQTVRQDDQTALVRAFFRVHNGAEQQVRIHLHARDGQWLLFDAEYAGFSLLRIWRAEIQGRLDSQSLDALIATLQQRHAPTSDVVPDPN